MTVYISPRVWGRVYAEDGTYVWQATVPDADGDADYVYLVNLVQALRLSLGESPFYSDVGIPGQRSVMQQLFPDFYATTTQQRFAQYFASLTITRLQPTDLSVGPVYQVNAARHNGSAYQAEVPT